MKAISIFSKSRFRLFWPAILLLALLGAAAGLPVDTAAQTGKEGQLTVVAPALNMRSGPGLTHPVVTVLVRGQILDIVAYDAASDWWQVRQPNGEGVGWVSGGSDYVVVPATFDNLANPVASTSAIPAGRAPVSGLTGSDTIVFQTTSGGPIYAIDASGSNLRYLTTGLDPVLSPDGQWLAFTRWETNQNGALGSLWVMPLDGGSERVILNDALQPRTPTWSPDGSRIVISMQHGGRIREEDVCGNLRPPKDATDVSIDREGRRITGFCYTLPPDPFWGLRSVDVATGAFEDLPNESYSFSPTLDPVNSWRLIYDGNTGLVSLDLDQGTSRPLTSDVNDRSPIFSPDGSRLAVSYWQHDHWEIHVLNADGGGRARLTETPYSVFVTQQLNGESPRSWNNAAPVWSPDGSQIAFLSDRRGSWEIWVMNADGTDQKPMFPADTLAEAPIQFRGVDERVLSWR